MFYKLILVVSKLYSFIFLRGFHSIGKNTIIKPILNSMNRDKISIGNNVNIGIFSWISVSTSYGNGKDLSKNTIRLKIGNNVDIGNNAFIVANNNVEIGDNVIMGPYVYISDHIHEYENIKENLHDQPLSANGFVTIGKNVFIGIKACILPNVTIGDRAVIGALSVVTKNVPAYSVVVGNPAKIVKRYNFKTKKWERV
jgi:lipopolysaccharide O-acetyltransferase